MRVMSAGEGYRYLLSSVAAGDGHRSLTAPLIRYYTEKGCPPGYWLGIGVHAARHFERVKTNIKTFNEPTMMVTDGMFRWTRNPMYLGMCVLLLGLAILLGTLLPLLLAVAFAVIADRWYVRFEENAMRRKFGAAYDAYASRTRRWL